MKHKDIVIFDDLIKASNNTVDNINYFSIYKILEEAQADASHYEQYYNQLEKIVEKKSDNIRLLMGKMKGLIAKRQEKEGNYY